MDFKVYKHKKDTLITKSPRNITIYEFNQLINKSNIVNFLTSYIEYINDLKIIDYKKRKVVSQLKYSVIKEIIEDALKEFRFFQNLIIKNNDAVVNMLMFAMQSGDMEDVQLLDQEKEIFEYIKKYQGKIDLYLDHNGNIIHFPVKGAIEDQPYYEIEIIKRIKHAKLKLKEREGG
jgi:hypothetical protein